MMATLPACAASLRGPVDSVVTCSDASETGLGVSRSVKLSELGRSFVAELRHRYGTEAIPVPIRPTDFDNPRVLLLSLFDGIGGARRALERLRLSVCLYLSVELDPGAMHVVREAWAEVIELGDVCAVGRLVLGPLFSKGAEMGCQVVVCAGGFPCQDVSLLNRYRAGAEGTRSGLFREFIRVTRLGRHALHRSRRVHEDGLHRQGQDHIRGDVALPRALLFRIIASEASPALLALA